MTQTQKMINKSTKEIELYIFEMLGTSVDSIDSIRVKIDIHKGVIWCLRDVPINEENISHYEEIGKILNGIREIKGLTPLELISNKLEIMQEHISFINELSEEE